MHPEAEQLRSEFEAVANTLAQPSDADYILQQLQKDRYHAEVQMQKVIGWVPSAMAKLETVSKHYEERESELTERVRQLEAERDELRLEVARLRNVEISEDAEAEKVPDIKQEPPAALPFPETGVEPSAMRHLEGSGQGAARPSQSASARRVTERLNGAKV